MRRKLSLGVLVLIDAAIVSFTPFLALMIRFEEADSKLFVSLLLPLMAVIIFVRLMSFYGFGLYHRLWRYASINELLAIVGAVTLSSIIITTYSSLVGAAIPISIHIISWGVTIILVGLSRLGIWIAYYFQINILHRNHKTKVVGA